MIGNMKERLRDNIEQLLNENEQLLAELTVARAGRTQAIESLKSLLTENEQLREKIKEMEYEIERLEELSQETYQELSHLEQEATDE